LGYKSYANLPNVSLAAGKVRQEYLFISARGKEAAYTEKEE
jgi:hypothetical protein